MSILIKGMDIPDKTIRIVIDSDGSVYQEVASPMSGGFRLKPFGKVVEVPTPHGRLIDADALIKYVLSISKSDYNKACILQQVDFAPTILEAEE